MDRGAAGRAPGPSPMSEFYKFKFYRQLLAAMSKLELTSNGHGNSVTVRGFDMELWHDTGPGGLHVT